MYDNRIAHLEEAHRVLDKKIDGLEKTGVFEDENLHELKKQRLFLKDEIANLKQKQANTIDNHNKQQYNTYMKQVCTTCQKQITPNCDWRQGRCPHRKPMFESILSDNYKSRFYNLINFFKGKQSWQLHKNNKN